MTPQTPSHIYKKQRILHVYMLCKYIYICMHIPVLTYIWMCLLIFLFLLKSKELTCNRSLFYKANMIPQSWACLSVLNTQYLWHDLLVYDSFSSHYVCLRGCSRRTQWKDCKFKGDYACEEIWLNLLGPEVALSLRMLRNFTINCCSWGFFRMTNTPRGEGGGSKSALVSHPVN